MKIYIDIGKREKRGDFSGYFISIPITQKEAISFDNSTKAYRVQKQVLVKTKIMPNDLQITSEWDSIIIEDGNFVGIEHIKWHDMDKKDWCNNEIWETVSEMPIPKKLNMKLLKYSEITKKHYKELNKFSKEMKEFEKLLLKKFDYYREKL